MFATVERDGPDADVISRGKETGERRTVKTLRCLLRRFWEEIGGGVSERFPGGGGMLYFRMWNVGLRILAMVYPGCNNFLRTWRKV